ncbi:MAG: hypothetical protein QG656_579, partial [Candidatus Hydrogenedentes bacterium]|nr:hypothetical protein [Candidatus Hydrogenedentota bacterium]
MNNRPIYVPCLTLALIFLAAAAGKPAVRQTFVDQGRRLTVGANPSAIVAPDLNEDGLPEIVTADIGTMTDPREERPAHDQLSLLVAKGDLAYEPQPQLQTGFAPYAIVVANVDALKAPDLVVGSFLADRQRNFTLFRNLRNNLFEAIDFGIPRDTELPYKRQTDGDGASVFTTPGITSMIVADVNHDSYRDVVAAGWSSDLLVFLPGVPETYFGPP